MDKAFINCRLYSCRRLICTSNMKSGSSSTPSCLRTKRESCSFFSRLTAMNSSVMPSMCGASALRAVRSVLKPVPMRPAMSRESSGSHKSSQRRCVTPLVTLVKRSG